MTVRVEEVVFLIDLRLDIPHVALIKALVGVHSDLIVGLSNRFAAIFWIHEGGGK